MGSILVIVILALLVVPIIRITALTITIIMNTGLAHQTAVLLIWLQGVKILINFHITSHIISVVRAATTNTLHYTAVAVTLWSIAPATVPFLFYRLFSFSWRD